MHLTTHNYFTRRTADQRNRTYHAFADHNCLHAMIDLLKVLEKCTKNLIGHSRLAFNNHEWNIDC